MVDVQNSPNSLDTETNGTTGDKQASLKPWYRPDPRPYLKPSVIKFYKDYVNLEGSALLEHLHAIRNQAWPLGEYPCIGQWLWLWSTIPTLPTYTSALARLHDGGSVLDLGCCFGQDLRRLAADGAPTTNMYASDLHGELWELGYDLYRDRATMKARFIQGDVLDAGSRLGELRGQIDVFVVCKFLHLFSWEAQVAICKRVVDLSRPGAIVLGYQLGQVELVTYKPEWRTMCFQNAKTFKAMWAKVSEETGTAWEVEVQELPASEWGQEPEDYLWMGPTVIALNFTVTRSDRNKMPVDEE